MALAGLWETGRSPAGERVRGFAIITTTSNELCAELHDRMPVILKPKGWPVWLGEQPADPLQLTALLAPYPAEEMVAWPVGPPIDNVNNSDTVGNSSRARRSCLPFPLLGVRVRHWQSQPIGLRLAA
jgi:putative SOS response-associated peptidase YedK